MPSPPEDSAPIAPHGAGPAPRAVDARGASAVQIGDGTTQIVYTYNRLDVDDQDCAVPAITVTADGRSPYQGLRSFGERDAAFFFGREAMVTEVLARMARRLDGGLLAVSGVSGSGKSSLLQAGVLPHFRGTGLPGARAAHTWPCATFTPGTSPLDELALAVAPLAGLDAAEVRLRLGEDPATFALTVRQAVRTTGSDQRTNSQQPVPPRLVLFIDQFEELFTLCSNAAERDAFIGALEVAAAPDPRGPAALVIISLRADFESRASAHSGLVDAIQHRYLVTAMTERQLRLAITEPARAVGAQVDDSLVRALLDEIDQRHDPAAAPASDVQLVYGAGVLALLSHGLDQAWRLRAESHVLTLADYERTGGIDRAIADSAQRTYDALDEVHRAAARRIFLSLTTSGPDGLATSRRVERAELDATGGTAEVLAVVLERFAAARLVTLGADTVQIAHEVVITAWPLLRDTWLAQSRADLIVRHRIRSATEEWIRQSRDSSYLFAGSLLDQAEATAGRITADPVRFARLSDDEVDFVGTSQRLRRRSIRRSRLSKAMIIALAVAVAVFAVVVNQNSQRRRVDQAAQDAAARFIMSQQLVDRSTNLLRTDRQFAALTALAADQINPTPQTGAAMSTALSYVPNGVRRGQLPAADAVAIGGGVVWVATPAGIQAYTPDTFAALGKPVRASSADDPAATLRLSADGRRLVAAGYGTISTFAIDGEKQLHHENSLTMPPGADPINLIISSDGRHSFFIDEAGRGRVTDLRRGRTTTTVRRPIDPGFENVVNMFDVSAGGRWLALVLTSAEAGNDLVWVDVDRGESKIVQRDAADLGAAAALPSGQVLVASNEGELARISRHGTWATTGHLGRLVEHIAVSSGGTIAMAGGGDVFLVGFTDTEPATSTLVSEPDTRTIAAMGFVGPHTLATYESDGRLLVVDTSVQRQTGSPYSRLAIDPTGTTAASAQSGSELNASTFSRGPHTNDAVDSPQTFSVSVPKGVATPARFDPDQVDVTQHYVGVVGGAVEQVADGSRKDGLVALWRTGSKSPIVWAHCQEPDPQEVGITSEIKITDDESMLLVTQGPLMCRWRLPSGERLDDLDLQQHDADGEHFSAHDLSTGANLGIVVVDNGSGPPSQAMLVDLETGTRQTVGGHDTAAAISGDGRHFATADSDRILTIRSTGGEMKTLKVDLESTAAALAWSPDSSGIAVLYEDGTIAQLDTVTGRLLSPPVVDGYGRTHGEKWYSENAHLDWPVPSTILKWDHRLERTVDLTQQANWKEAICSSEVRITEVDWTKLVSSDLPYRDPCA